MKEEAIAMNVGGGTVVVDSEKREMADLALRLNRDTLWLERELRRIRDATACDGGKLRALAAVAIETAKKRRKRTMSKSTVK